jgi:hypothetical protein
MEKVESVAILRELSGLSDRVFSLFVVVQGEPNFPAVQGKPAYRRNPASGRDSRVQVKVWSLPGLCQQIGQSHVSLSWR